jgi:hypothetical protein
MGITLSRSDAKLLSIKMRTYPMTSNTSQVVAATPFPLSRGVTSPPFLMSKPIPTQANKRVSNLVWECLRTLMHRSSIKLIITKHSSSRVCLCLRVVMPLINHKEMLSLVWKTGLINLSSLKSSEVNLKTNR